MSCVYTEAVNCDATPLIHIEWWSRGGDVSDGGSGKWWWNTGHTHKKHSLGKNTREKEKGFNLAIDV